MTQPHLNQTNLTHADVEHRFGYHRATFPVGWIGPDDPDRLSDHDGELDDAGNLATGPRHATIREIYIDAGKQLVDMLPEGRCKSLAFSSLEESLHWANTAIAMEAPLVKE